MRISDTFSRVRTTVHRARDLVSNTAFSVAVTAAFLVIGTTTAAHHEMWRDEMQAWLLARDSSGPIELLGYLQYEGHPGLWHLGLVPLTRLTWNPAIMQAFHLLIATAAVYLFCARSPFTRLQKLLFAFGYFTLYEYSIVCRNYGVGMLLLCLFAAGYQERVTRPLRPAIALFLLAHTSVHALIVTIALLGALFLDHLLITLGESESVPLRRARVWMSLLVIAAGIGTSMLQLDRPGDYWSPSALVLRDPNKGWKTEYVRGDAERSVMLVTNAYLPVPEAKRRFWGSHRLERTDWFAGELYNRHRFGVALGLIALFAITLLTRPTAFVAFGVATSGLLMFFYVTNFGSLRHWGFLYLTLIIAHWIARSAWTSRRSAWASVDRWLWKAGGIALTGIMLVQAWGGITAVRMEREYVFSYGKVLAEYIRENGLADHTIIGQFAPAASTVLGYLRKDRFYYTNGARFGSFILWSERSMSPSDDQVVATAEELSDDTLVIRSDVWPEENLKRHGVEELTRLTGAITEDFFLYRIRAASNRSEETDGGP